MKTILIQTTQLMGERHFSVFYPNGHFPVKLFMELSIENLDFTDPSIEIRGKVEFHHSLVGEIKDKKTFLFSESDFKHDTFKCMVNTGDLIYKVVISLVYTLPATATAYLKHELTEGPVSIFESGSIRHLYKSIKRNEPLKVLEEIRDMAPWNFLKIITADLPVLEAIIDKAPGQAFNRWAITDKIIRLAGTGKIPLSYLDFAAQKYSTQYATTKEKLALNEICH
jgi:hypothetical protein